MNNARRKQIEDVKSRVIALRDDLQSILEDEQEYFDAMPEAFQDGQKGEAAQAAIGALEEAIGAFDQIEESCDQAVSG